MKVRELIEQLQRVNPEARVNIGAPHGGALEVEKVEDFGEGTRASLVYVDGACWAARVEISRRSRDPRKG